MCKYVPYVINSDDDYKHIFVECPYIKIATTDNRSWYICVKKEKEDLL